MSYEPKQWKVGDTITANDLNHMEDGIENATGFTCTEEMTILTDETVITETSRDISAGTLTYTEPITADTIKVTFDGVEYTCQNEANANGGLYGDTSGDFAEYPFVLESNSAMDAATGTLTIDNVLYTKTAGTYDIIIEANALTVTETTECFVKAVNQVVEIPDTQRMSSITFIAPEHDGTIPETGSTTITAGLGAPTVSVIYNNISKNWVARYEDYLMPLVRSTSTKAVFSASTFETVNSATVLRHREIVYTSSNAKLTVSDIQIP